MEKKGKDRRSNKWKDGRKEIRDGGMVEFLGRAPGRKRDVGLTGYLLGVTPVWIPPHRVFKSTKGRGVTTLPNVCMIEVRRTFPRRPSRELRPQGGVDKDARAL